MAIIRTRRKLQQQLDSALRSKSKGRDYIKLVETALASVPADLSEDDAKSLSTLRYLRAIHQWENGEKHKALDGLLEVFAGDYVEEEWSALVADFIRNDGIVDIKYRGLLEKRLENE